MRSRVVVALFVALAILGWAGLGYFCYHNPPFGWNRWIAVAILWPTVVVTLLPLLYRLHFRRGVVDGLLYTSFRQSALAALLLCLCVWLRMVRALNWANGALLLLLFVLTEILLSSRRAT